MISMLSVRSKQYPIIREQGPITNKRVPPKFLMNDTGYGYGYTLGPSLVPPIYLSGSFGLVRPAWIYYTRSAVPQDVEYNR